MRQITATTEMRAIAQVSKRQDLLALGWKQEKEMGWRRYKGTIGSAPQRTTTREVSPVPALMSDGLLRGLTPDLGGSYSDEEQQDPEPEPEPVQARSSTIKPSPDSRSYSDQEDDAKDPANQKSASVAQDLDDDNSPQNYSDEEQTRETKQRDSASRDPYDQGGGAGGQGE